MKSILKKFGGTILAVCALNLTILAQSCSQEKTPQVGDVKANPVVVLEKPIIWEKRELGVNSITGVFYDKVQRYKIVKKFTKDSDIFYVAEFSTGSFLGMEVPSIYVMENEQFFSPYMMQKLGYKRIQ